MRPEVPSDNNSRWCECRGSSENKQNVLDKFSRKRLGRFIYLIMFTTLLQFSMRDCSENANKHVTNEDWRIEKH